MLKEAIRRAKYKNETIEEAFLHFSHYEKKSALPYINMISLSMQDNDCPRSFKLFIVRELFDHPQLGAFNCYGLSKAATIPCVLIIMRLLQSPFCDFYNPLFLLS